jgi:hypothetical protein
MGKETALFEDDFGTEFEDVFGEGTMAGANDSAPADPFEGIETQPVQPVTEFAAKPVHPAAFPYMPNEPVGGDAMLPAISIKLF